MNITEIKAFLAQLKQRGITLSLGEDKLLCKAEKGAMDKQTAAQIAQNKAVIMAHLEQQARLRQQQKHNAQTPVISPSEGPAMLSVSQQGLWFIDQINGDNANYNMPSANELHGELNVAALDKALVSVIERHQVLRTTICAQRAADDVNESLTDTQSDVQATLSVLPVPQSVLTFHDKSALRQEQIDAFVAELITDSTVKPFALDSDYLLRATLVKTAPQRHALIMTLHHIAADGWSLGILFKEIAALYQAYAQGQSNPLAPLELQYRDYAKWQVEQSADLSQPIAFWREYLAGAEPVHGLLLDKPRPSMPRFQGRMYRQQLPHELLRGLKQVAQHTQCTLFMVMQSAFALLIARYSNTDDVVLGTPVANRLNQQTADLMGFFVNTAVLRSNFAGNPGFAEFLKQNKAKTLSALSHQSFTFDQLVDALEIEHSINHNPVFQIMFLLSNSFGEGLKLSGLDTTPLEITAHTSKFDLFVDARETHDGIEVEWEYDTDLFEHQSIERMSEAFECLLYSIVDNAEQQVMSLPMLPSNQSEQLLYQWQAPQNDISSQPTVLERFECQVQQAPDSVALVFEQQPLTYRALNAQANHLARQLCQSLGGERGLLPRDTLVALHFDRGFEMIVAILAVYKAGGAYLPIAPQNPFERTAFIVEDAKVNLVLTQAHYVDYLSQLKDTKVHCVPSALNNEAELDGQSAIANSAGADVPLCALAYVIYTSGTTGTPKGVMVEHQVLSNLIANQIKSYGMQADDSVLLLSPYYFDVSVEQIFCALCVGAKLVLPKLCDIQQLDKIERIIIDNQVTQLGCTTSYLMNLNNDDALASVKRVLSAGEPATQALKKRFGNRLINCYGPTETHIATQSLDYAEQPFVNCIGRGIDNALLYVLDKNKQPVPVNCPGELYIGGAVVGRGYLNREELTAQCFINDPFVGDALRQPLGGRMYKTGDLVRWLNDGQLEYLGRNDTQVKIRGFRIELGEVETALSELPEVKQAAVVDREHEGSKFLAAFVVANDGVELVVDELVKGLSRRLADYMVPASFTFIDAIPLTNNGKLDKRALPQQVEWVQKDYVAPVTPEQKALCQIWQDVLKIERVGIYDDFFCLGGNSIMAMKLTNASRKALGVDITLQMLFEQKTVAGLADVLDSASATTIAARHLDAYPLSYAQQRLLFVQSYIKDSNIYHMPFIAKLDKSEQSDAAFVVMQQAIEATIARHQVLNSVFVRDKDSGQILSRRLTQPLQWITRTVSGSLQQCIKQDIDQPFDLFSQVPLRLYRYHADDGQYIMMLWHHIAFDGWSINVFFSELKAIWQSLTKNTGASLAAVDIQYGDYALWQRDYLSGDTLSQLEHYWQEQLADVQTLQLPTDYPRPSEIDYRGANFGFTVAPELADKLRAVAKSQQTSLYNVLLSGYFISLASISGQTDIVIGTPSDNRQQTQAQSLVGFFVNTLVLRAEVDKRLSGDEFIRQVQQVGNQAKVHQELPFEQLVELLDVPRDTSRHPLFQVMFTLNELSGEGHFCDGLPFDEVDFGVEQQLFTPAKNDLSLTLSAQGSSLKGVFNYATSLFKRDTIARFSDKFILCLEQLVSLADRPLSELELVSAAEKAQLAQYNKTYCEPLQRTYSETTLVQLFEQQVSRTPEALALSCEGKSLSYFALNQAANRVAHDLRAQYAKSQGQEMPVGTVVGLYVERGLDMIIAILAVLKAGGAYLPMALNSPKQRLNFLIENASVDWLMTTSDQVDELKVMTQGNARTLSCIAVDESLESDHCQSNPDIKASCDDLAYVIYTSGTTGTPKGVMLSHQNAVNGVSAITQKFALSNYKTTLFYNAYVFDPSVMEIFCPLLCGSHIHIASEAMRKDIAALHQYLGEHPIEWTALPPALVSLLDENKLGKLKAITLGGEMTKLSDFERLSRKLKVFNAYGPTEASIISSANLFSAGTRVGDIGAPLSNVQYYVLDDMAQLVSPGCVGELYIGGAGVAKGYINRDDLTQAQFIDNPFATSKDKALGYERLYKTGDIVRWLGNGHIEYLGRRDAQVKIRGFRIELAEIENALMALHGIKQAVVIDVKTNDLTRLAAYVVMDEGFSFDPQTILNPLSEQLPDYMLPTALMAIDAVPLTVNGKCDVRALPKPEFVSQQNYVAPRNEVEQILCDIWQSVLGLEQVGVFDDYFAIGGNSINAMRLAGRVAAELECQLPLSLLFEQKNIAAIAASLSNGKAAGAKLSKITAQSQTRYPLSFAQQRMLFLDRFDQGNTAYNVPYLVALKGGADVDGNYALIVQTVNVIAERHQVLRSIYVSDAQGDDYQQLLECHIDIDRVAVRDDAELREKIKAAAEHSFVLAEEAPFKVVWLDAPDKQYLLFNWHHIAFDGWSIDVFLQEFSSVYTALSQQRSVDIAPLEVQYGDYALWQKAQLSGANTQSLKDYWQQKLSGFSTLELPTTYARPNQFDYRGANYNFTLDVELSNQLRELAKQQNTSLYVVMLSAYYLMLAKVSGQDDIVVGTVTANREQAQTQSLIGFFINSLALRTQIDEKAALNGFVQQVNQMFSEAQQHQQLPFEQLVELLALEQDASRHPIFQTTFSLQRFGCTEGGQLLPFAPVGLELKQAIGDAAKFDLSLNIVDSQQGLAAGFNYAQALFDEATVAQFSRHYTQVLSALVGDIDQQVGQINMVTEQDRQWLMAQANVGADDAYWSTVPVTTAFAQQVSLTPGAIAVEQGENSLTYEQLDAQSTALAQGILATQKGGQVAPDSLIALHMDCDIEMIVAMLAVLKAGAAYVPVSTEFPQQRALYLLSDSAPVLVICSDQYKPRLTQWLDDAGQDLQVITPAACTAEQVTLPQVSADNLAYVIYTSGTTGQPKGVAVEHRAAVSLVKDQAYIDIGVNDCVLQQTTPNFDISVFEIYGALLNGAKLVIPPDRTLEISTFGRLLKTSNITVMIMSGSLFDSLYVQDNNVFNNVKYLLLGGDVLTTDLIAKLVAQKQRPEHVLNCYGPTEAGVLTSFYECTEWGRSVPIGQAVKGRQMYVMANDSELAPIGCAGELYIGGAGLAREYLNKPELSAASFIPSVFDPAKRLYKSGDKVRWLPDGQLEYLGRGDSQVKIRGHRIELKEIERVMCTIELVSQAAVVSRVHQGEKYLAAFVTINEGQTCDSDSLKQSLAERLPKYMVPSIIVALDKLPLNVNGKLDVRALPETDLAGNQNSDLYIEASTALEKALSLLWQRVLKLEKISIDADFFNVGGNSLNAARLTTLIQKEIAPEVKLADVFNHKSIAQLAAYIAQADFAVNDDCQVTLRSDGDKAPLFLFQPVGGHAFCYQIFAHKLDINRPVYGFQRPEIANQLVPAFLSIEQLAALYIERLQQTQPQGPYYLGGWSSGGVLAMEAAAQLEAQGKEVACLVIFDAMLSNGKGIKPEHHETGLANLNKLSHHQKCQLMREQYEELPAFEIEGDKLKVSADDYYEYIISANQIGLNFHKPRFVLQAPTHYVVATHQQTESFMNERIEGIASLMAKPLDIDAVDSTHFGMMEEPHVEEVAAIATRVLNRY